MLATSPSTPSVARPFSMRTSTRMENAYCPISNSTRAQVIVSFGADFLGTWISPVEFTAAWSTHRVPVEGHARMSYHVQLEGRMSLTGSNADHRYRLAPDEYAVTLSYLAHDLAVRAGKTAPEGSVGTSPIPEAELAEIADRLWRARGESLVLCDSQDVEVQVLVNAINHYLGNYGQTIDIARPSRQKQSNDAEVLELIEELKSGSVSALFVAGTDLTHNLPDREALSEAIGKMPLGRQLLRSGWTIWPRWLTSSARIFIRCNHGWMPSR